VFVSAGAFVKFLAFTMVLHIEANLTVIIWFFFSLLDFDIASKNFLFVAFELQQHGFYIFRVLVSLLDGSLGFKLLNTLYKGHVCTLALNQKFMLELLAVMQNLVEPLNVTFFAKFTPSEREVAFLLVVLD